MTYGYNLNSLNLCPTLYKEHKLCATINFSSQRLLRRWSTKHLWLRYGLCLTVFAAWRVDICYAWYAVSCQKALWVSSAEGARIEAPKVLTRKFWLFIQNSAMWCYFRILILKSYLQSNAVKGTSSHGILVDWWWYIHETSSCRQSRKLTYLLPVSQYQLATFSQLGMCYRPRIVRLCSTQGRPRDFLQGGVQPMAHSSNFLVTVNAY